MCGCLIRALIFDLDNTIYNENDYFLKTFEKFSERNKLEFRLFKTNFTDEFRLSSKDIFTDILKIVDSYSLSKQEELFNLYKSIDTKLELFKDARWIIDYANGNNIKIGIITNGVLEAQRNKVKCLDIGKKFDSIIYARKFGKKYEKPNAKPFEESLLELKVDSDSVIYIGDDPYTDIFGARANGIKSIFLKRGYLRNKPHLADYEISDLRYIRNIMEIFNAKDKDTGDNRN